MSEALEQRTVVEWCELRRVPYFHVPNGGSRNKAEAANLKRQGVRPGVPDLCVPVARCGYHGLFIEMKAKTGGRVSGYQAKWIQLLREQGYAAYVCEGADSAIRLLELYMGGGLHG